ncbi:MAG: hypothetical protein ABI813_04505 [Bacteroidota bacterium]
MSGYWTNKGNRYAFAKVERITLLAGANGSQWHISVVEKEKRGVFIVNEVHEWATAEYIRDTPLLDEKTSLLVQSTVYAKCTACNGCRNGYRQK